MMRRLLIFAFACLSAGGAAAQDAPCRAPNPGDIAAVYACFQSGGFGPIDRLTCEDARGRYLSLLTQSGLTGNRAQQYLPACELIARVVSDLTGSIPEWNGCLGYPGGFDAGHFRRCLGAAPESRSCPELIEAYRQGLAAADRYGQLPALYRNPDCETVAAALTPAGPASIKTEAAQADAPRATPPEWVKCLGYDPANAGAHMKSCLGPDYAVLLSCEAVQRAYEQNLKAAYNGLPPGYLRVTCPQAEAIVNLATAQIEERRQAAVAEREAEERRRAERLAARTPPPPVTSVPAPSPGASGGWGALILIALVVIGALAIVAALARKAPAKKDLIGRGGSARFANLAELQAAAWMPGHFFLGLAPAESSPRPFRVGHDDDRHVFLVAQTGAGKGTSIIINNLIEWPGSAFVIDPKGENAMVTAMRRGHLADARDAGSAVTECLGQDVYILDPFRQVAGPARSYVCNYNPLAELDIGDPGIATAIGMVAEAIVLPEEGTGRHFSDLAQTLLAGVIEYVLTDLPRDRQTLIAVRDLLLGGRDVLKERLAGVGTRTGLSAEAAAVLSEVGTNEGGGIYSTLANNLKWLSDIPLHSHVSGHDFSMRAIKDDAATVYLVLPPKLVNQHRRWLRLMVNIALHCMQAELHPRERPPCLFVLDEFPVLGNLAEMETAAGLMRGYGVKLFPAIQNIGQLGEHYPRNWETFLGNAGAIIAFGLNDLETQKYVSERLGKYELVEEERSESVSRSSTSSVSGGGSSSTSRSVSKQNKRQIVDLRTPDEVQRDTARETGNMYVVRADGFPLRLKRVPYFELYRGDGGRVVYDDPAASPGASRTEAPRPLRKPPTSPARPRVQPAPVAPELVTPTRETGEDDPLLALGRMIGLAGVKRQVEDLASLVLYQQRRKAAGLPAPPQSHHLVFTGNPGTGKTTVGQVIAAIYRRLGLLEKGHLVEVGRKDLVGQNWGSGGEKTAKVIEQALDGVLFIDEAYALNLDHKSSNGDPLGHEAIAALIDAMEKNRDRLAVIVAGYPREMDRFFEANPGLASRFGTRIHFPDYSPEELVEIFRRLCEKDRYRLTPGAEAKLVAVVTAIHSSRGEGFGNGRAMRNLFEKTIRRQAARVTDGPEADEQDLVTLTEGDIEGPAAA